MSAIDFEARFQIAGNGGVAWRLLGYETFRDEDYEWTGIEEENRDRVRAVMVGDDRVFTFDVEDLIEIPEDAYCAECGQISCTADGRG